MKLTAHLVPYSSVVGGGLQLIDEVGIARFQVSFMGTYQGITKQETQALQEAFQKVGVIEVPDRK